MNSLRKKRIICYRDFRQIGTKYGKSAGYRRNVEMAKFAIEDQNKGLLIAFWDGKSRGTKWMIDIAKRYDLDVEVVQYVDGE